MGRSRVEVWLVLGTHGPIWAYADRQEAECEAGHWPKALAPRVVHAFEISPEELAIVRAAMKCHRTGDYEPLNRALARMEKAKRRRP